MTDTTLERSTIRYDLPMALQALGQTSVLFRNCVQAHDRRGSSYEKMLESAVELLCGENRQLFNRLVEKEQSADQVKMVTNDSRNPQQLAQDIMGIHRTSNPKPVNTDFRDRPTETQAEYFGKS